MDKTKQDHKFKEGYMIKRLCYWCGCPKDIHDKINPIAKSPNCPKLSDN